MRLDFFQVYFKDEHVTHLYDFSTPYKNEVLTPYFENSVIADLVPKSSADLIAVCSWRLKEKRNEGSSEGILRRQNGHTVLTETAILSTPFDVAVLTPRNNLHQPLAMASNWHGKAWDDAFTVFKRYLRSQHGIKVPDELSKAIYENHFIARRELYHEYVEKILVPSMEFMETNEVFSVDAGYAKRKRSHEVADYLQKSGRSDWPISVFVLERLFSIWIEGKSIKVVNL